ncbi:MAG: glycine dehydrogenase, partial [Planctomycetes bacterium]|nr:glycine dehydrogenase [Planctomycetota bacterium]
MPYVQITPSQRQQMLRAIGVESVEGLFCGVPEPLRLDRPLSLPAAVSEQVLMAELAELIAHNRHGGRLACFAGGGAYDHFIPAVVDAIASRGEFLTAYTPYQPEASQGSLQAFFEFQTLICQLTGMAVANASMYEAASALAEAILMLTGPSRQRVIVCEPIHPHYLATVRTYLVDSPVELVVVPQAGGSADAQGLMVQLTADTAAVVVQSPNFYGVIE